MSAAAIAFALVCGLGGYLAAITVVVRGSNRCPACRERTLVVRSLVRGRVWPPVNRTPIDETLYRCEACGAEFGREGRGPLIPRHAWDAGAREAFPAARVLPKGHDA